ncbi:alpha/beta fold hydrolase [Desulfogranum japonicum]|uniref:alpha/beta fold hydrolase n=1 Tax=Desulfogranum japonicum TaxID=231447 RepID=UPI00040320AF|nr:alpha/beta fold hydrolase [Desulfogranum japonicum]
MNRSAYLTTGIAIQALSRLSKANISVHGKENIPDAPCIFVVNHFTRIETFILPHQIFSLTGIPVWSLANAQLFQGGFGRYIEMVGAVSTNHPQRDELITRTLLTGEAHWIIFPEGSMVKTKKIVHGGKYMATNPKGLREPHTGAAILAMRAELFKRYLDFHADDPSLCQQVYQHLGLSELKNAKLKSPSVVPVNLTYYPLRARENVAATLAAKMIKDLPDRILEEIMIEGTMLLSGVDLDIRFGKPMTIAPILERKIVTKALKRKNFQQFLETPELHSLLKKQGKIVMQQYMHAIYSMTTINHDHLFATFLRLYPYQRVQKRNLLRRVYLAAMTLQKTPPSNCRLHSSLQHEQHHLLIDDRFKKFSNFLQLAKEKGIVQEEGKTLLRDRSKLSAPVSFHHGRIDNPVEIIANEVEPLERLQKVLFSLAWQPDTLLRAVLARYLLKKSKQQYAEDKQTWQCQSVSLLHKGAPILYPRMSRKTGIVLVHSYLSSPQELKTFARWLNSQGYWVYVPRLPGHGTCAEDLAGRTYEEWIDAVEEACILLDTVCRQVIIGGVGLGGNLSLHIAARTPWIKGVFSVSAPFRLKDYSTRFMPSTDVWNTMVQKISGGEKINQSLDFIAENPNINYRQNPVSGIREVGKLLTELAKLLKQIQCPTLLLHGDNDPLVHAKGGRLLFKKIGSEQKELNLLHCPCHVMVQGPDAELVQDRIASFIRSIS